MTQMDLACKLNSRQTTVSSWERGITTPPLDTIKKLAEIFDISLNDLLYAPARSTVNFSFEKNLVDAFYTADNSVKEQVCNLLGVNLSFH